MEDRRRSVNSACETMCDTVLRLDKQINGNGQPGIAQHIQAIREDLAAMRGAADARYRFTTILLSVLTIAVMLVALPNIAHALHLSELKMPPFLQPPSGHLIYAEHSSPPPQEAIGTRSSW